MRVLLDTHAWLWMLVIPERFSRDARALVADGTNDVLLSAASAREIAIKYALGKLPLRGPPQRYVPDRIRRKGVTPLSVEHSHALGVAALP
jgi:PIN domain nuclease of toxin-antitoxin system